MPLRLFECPECGIQFKTKQSHPMHCDAVAEPVMSAPDVKFMEKMDAEKGRSQMIGQQQILKERSRKHSRDVEMHDLIQNNETELSFQNGWLNKDGKKRTGIDDL